MPVPSLVTDLSTTAASNSPAGSDNVFPSLDDYLRAMSAFIASIRDNSGNGWVSPYLPLAGGTVTGATTFSNTVTGTKFIPTGTSATGNGMYLPATNTLGFSTNGAEVARLDSSGNLGIGTSSPASRLDVQSASTANAYRVANFYNSAATSTTAGSNVLLRVASNGSGADATLNLTDSTATNVFISNNNGNLLFGNGVGFVERMRLDSSGNLGLGVTPSAWLSSARSIDVSGYASFATWNNASGVVNNAFYNASSQWIYKNTAAATQYYQVGGQHVWLNAPSGTAGNAISFTQAMTLDASGNLFVTTGNSWAPTGAYAAVLGNSGKDAGLTTYYDDSSVKIGAGVTQQTGILIYGQSHANGNYIAFRAGNNERARITSGGDLCVGRTADVSSERLCVEKDLNAAFLARFRNTNSTSPFGAFITYTAAAPNGTTNQFLRCDDNAATRAEIRSNGGLANYSGNNVNLSDRREKTNFAPAKSYLDTICAIPVQTFNYIDQSEDDPGLTLGVVAQDVQAVAPELVMESNWGTEDNPKMRLSVYQTDLQYALMKCIQELKDEVDTLRARVAQLEGV